jgi:hypothetical protein
MVPEHRHAPVDEQQKTLNAKLRGQYQYYGRPTNSPSLLKFYQGVVRIWRNGRNRRPRGKRMTRERYGELLRRHPLLPPRDNNSVRPIVLGLGDNEQALVWLQRAYDEHSPICNSPRYIPFLIPCAPIRVRSQLLKPGDFTQLRN